MHLNKRIVEQHYYYQMKGAVEEMSNMAVLWSSWFTAGRHWLADSGWSQANTSRLYAGCSRLVKAIGITLKWPSVIIYLSRDTSIIDPRTEKKIKKEYVSFILSDMWGLATAPPPLPGRQRPGVPRERDLTCNLAAAWSCRVWCDRVTLCKGRSH